MDFILILEINCLFIYLMSDFISKINNFLSTLVYCKSEDNDPNKKLPIHRYKVYIFLKNF